MVPIEKLLHVVVDIGPGIVRMRGFVVPQRLFCCGQSVPLLACYFKQVLWAHIWVVLPQLGPIVNHKAHVAGPKALDRGCQSGSG